MKINIEKLHDRFNKRWIGSLYAFSIFFIFSSFGAIVGFGLGNVLGNNYIFLFLWLVLIGYAIALPIGYIRSYLRKNYKGDSKEICKDIKCGSYDKCDKIHCHQFYKYTDKGVIKREQVREMKQEYKKITPGSILICCCFGFLPFLFVLLYTFTGNHSGSYWYGVGTGVSMVFFVIVFDAINERSKKNKKIKSEVLDEWKRVN